MPISTTTTPAPQNVSPASNHEASQSKEMTPGFHQITGTGQSPAKSFIEQEADLVRAQIYEMEAFLIKFSGEWREAEVKVYDELLTKGKITQKKQSELYRNADSRSAKAKKEALNVANKAAKEPNISSKFTELKEFVEYEIISPQDSYQNFLHQLIQAEIITKGESPELFSRARDGKSAAQKLSTSPTDTTDTYEDCLEVQIPNYSDLDELVATKVISPQERDAIFFDRLVEKSIITVERSPELFPKAVDGKAAAQKPSIPAITPSTPLLSKDNLLSLTSDLRKDLEPY